MRVLTQPVNESRKIQVRSPETNLGSVQIGIEELNRTLQALIEAHEQGAMTLDHLILAKIFLNQKARGIRD